MGRSHSLRVASEAASILRRLHAKEASLRSLVFRSRLKCKKRLYRLCCACLQHSAALSAMLDSGPGRRLVAAAKIDRLLLSVLVYEAVISEEPAVYPGRMWDEIVAKRDSLLAAVPNGMLEEATSSSKSRGISDVPRYARVNQLKCNSVDDVHRALKRAGFELVGSPAGGTASFRRRVSSLQQRQYFMDTVVPGLLVFTPGTDLHQSSLVTGGQLVLMDRLWDCPQVELLGAALVGSAARRPCVGCLRGAGYEEYTHFWNGWLRGREINGCSGALRSVVSVERDGERMKTLRRLVHANGATNVKVLHQDFLKLRLDQDRIFRNVGFV